MAKTESRITRRACWAASASAAAIASALLAPGAFAATDTASASTTGTAATTQVEELIVTARQREENIEKVPVAVTAFTQARLENLQIRSSSDLQYSVPSVVNFRAGGGGNGAYAIRGLGNALNGAPSVIAYFSEAPDAEVNSGTPPYDLASVQVLRGPQGTLFGRATTGGAILFIPQHPVFNQWDGYGQVRVGNLGTLQGTAALNIPVVDDQLAIRVAVNREHVDGYTHVIGSDRTLSGVDNWAARVGVEYRSPGGRFDNYLVWNYAAENEEAGGSVIVGVNQGFSLFNLPASISAPNGAVFGAALFGALCTQAVSFGLSASVSACEDQRLQTAATFKPALLAELNRAAAGGQNLRADATGNTLNPQFEAFYTHQVVDIAQLDLGKSWLGDIKLRNIFSFSMIHAINSSDIDGTPAQLIDAASGQLGSSTQVGNQIIPGLGPWHKSYSEEFQVHGDSTSLNWIAGVYYAYAPVAKNTTGCSNLNDVFGGILTVNLGATCAFQFPISGYSWERGIYGQFTADLSRFIHGLHFTAGYRDTANYAVSTTAPVIFNYPSGSMTPGTPVQGTPFKSSGPGWTFALDDQLTDKLLVYVTTRRGYKPGGLNGTTGSTGAPGYTPTFGPELVTDVEVGTKLTFNSGEFSGYLNADYYRNWYTNIQESILNSVGPTVFTFNENAAAAILEGVELEGEVRYGDRLSLSGWYAHADNRFTQWFGGDPLSLAKPGNAVCDAAHSTSTSCILDLHNNPLAFSPKDSGSLTVRYKAPIDPDLGDLFGSLTYIGRTRVEFVPYANRFIQAFAATQGANVNDQISQPAYSLWNAELDWQHIRHSNFSASVWVYNIGNTIYADGAFATLASVGFDAKFFGPPRTFGVTLRYEFGK